MPRGHCLGIGLRTHYLASMCEFLAFGKKPRMVISSLQTLTHALRRPSLLGGVESWMLESPVSLLQLDAHASCYLISDL